MTLKEVIHTDVIYTELAQMNRLLTIYLIILGLSFRSLRIFKCGTIDTQWCTYVIPDLIKHLDVHVICFLSRYEFH